MRGFPPLSMNVKAGVFLHVEGDLRREIIRPGVFEGRTKGFVPPRLLQADFRPTVQMVVRFELVEAGTLEPESFGLTHDHLVKLLASFLAGCVVQR